MNLTRFPSVSNDIDSYGRPLANVIQRKPAQSYSDSYGEPLGEIITSDLLSVSQRPLRPLSTNSLSLINLNNPDSYGQPLAPVIAAAVPPQLSSGQVVDSESEVSRTRVKPLTGVTTKLPQKKQKKDKNILTDVLAVYPQLEADNNTKGRYLLFYFV